MRYHRIRNVSIVGLLAAATLALLPAAAHADGWRTVTATGEGHSNPAAEENAKTNARIKLISQAMQAREMCGGITASAEIQWYDPYREYFVFSGTATGYCAVTPPYTVFRASTRQASGYDGAQVLAAADAQARADVLALGVNCTNWLGGSKLIYASGGFVVYEATEWALCTN